MDVFSKIEIIAASYACGIVLEAKTMSVSFSKSHKMFKKMKIIKLQDSLL